MYISVDANITKHDMTKFVRGIGDLKMFVFISCVKKMHTISIW